MTCVKLYFFLAVIVVITHYNKLLVVTILLGVARGLRQVYMNRVLSESVPSDQLSSVSVLQMALNAIGFVLIGSILGVLEIQIKIF